MIGATYFKNNSLQELDITGITDGNIPYMSASGFADGPIYTDGTNVGIGTTGPAVKLEVAEDATSYPTVAGSAGFRVAGASGSSASIQIDAANNAASALYFGDIDAVAQGAILYHHAFDDLRFTTNGSEAVRIGSSGNVGIGETAPVTLTEWTGAAPYLTLHNNTHEDTDGGRESRLIARGEQSGGEETILGYLEFAHDGASDDQKGLFRVLLNDGDDGTTPSLTALTCGSTGEVQFHQTAHFDVEVDNGNSGAADTIDWTAGNKQKSTLTDNCTFTFSPEPSGPCSLTLKLVQDGTGSRTVTWPGDVKWPGGTAPTLSTGAADVDIITFYYDGTDFYGQSALDFS